MGKDEIVFYNLGIFNKDQRIIIFQSRIPEDIPETIYYLELKEKILKDALIPELEIRT